MTIRWDSVMVRSVAAELNEALAGTRLRGLRLDGRSRDLALLGRERTFLWRLHPRLGGATLEPPVDPGATDIRMRARIRGVSAPPDERIVRFELMPERSGRPLDLMVELIPNQWNAIAVDLDRVVRHVLVTRDRPRELRVGGSYRPPDFSDRLGTTGTLTAEEWLEFLGPVPPDERRRVLVRSVAWTSPLNAAWILGDAETTEGDDALVAALLRWIEIAGGSSESPTVREAQPYPYALGAPSDGASSFLEALSIASEVSAGDSGAPGLSVPPDIRRRLRDQLKRARRRAARLTSELAESPEPDSVRAIGDLILARLGSIDTKSDRVELVGFDGSTVEVDWDPSIPPHKNADRYYDRAGRAERARERLPGLIAEADAEAAEWERLDAASATGEIELEELLRRLPTRVDHAAEEDATLPYRTFRSTGGLEIRVGRGARHNDALTFHHSAPNDVWMHTQQTPGAHVILRWNRSDTPPARDLQEAATLAALHSKARTSTTVPVAWTLRKYVRKPRGSAPGSVVPDRVKTVFVEPDESLLDRLADSWRSGD